jgi:hypothetical protein
VQHGDKFELRINNQSFSHLWENEKTKRNFEFHENINNNTNAYQAKDYTGNFDIANDPTSRQKQADPYKYQTEKAVDHQMQKAIKESMREEEERQRRKESKRQPK